MRFTRASLEAKKMASGEVVSEEARIKHKKSAALEASEVEATSGKISTSCVCVELFGMCGRV